MKMNDALLKVINERASTREFDSSKKVSENLVRKILSAGISAPSAGNIQPRTFIVVKDEVVKKQLYDLCENQAFMKDANLWIVVCADLHRHLRAAELTGVQYDYTGIVPFTFSVLDTGLSLENMVIAADSLGLGSVIIGSIIEHPEEARTILKLPKHSLAVSILCVGHPRQKPRRRAKWSKGTIVYTDTYKDVDYETVREYWKRFIMSDMKRSGRRMSMHKLEELIKKGKQMNYGEAYSRHYTVGFIKNSNVKLSAFLKEQGFL